jgi:hypothetical protein
MGVTLTISTDLPRSEVVETVEEALRNQLALARARYEQFRRECLVFEEANKMKSDEFLQRFEAGELGDEARWFDWFAAKRGMDLWARKLNVLNEVRW